MIIITSKSFFKIFFRFLNSLSNLELGLLRELKGKDAVGLSDCEELVRITHRGLRSWF